MGDILIRFSDENIDKNSLNTAKIIVPHFIFFVRMHLSSLRITKVANINSIVLYNMYI